MKHTKQQQHVEGTCLSGEEAQFQLEVAECAEWMDSSRFLHTKRAYDASAVVRLRPTVMHSFPGTAPASKLWKMCVENSSTGSYSHTFGALDPVQVVQMAPYLTSVYVSGTFFFVGN